MLTLIDLWLPILVSAVFVFIASSLLHMVIPIHRSDFRQLPSEQEVLAAMRNQGVKPGEYMFPWACSMQELGQPEVIAKFDQGPVGLLTVMPNGPITMGKNLAQWFVYCIVMGVFVAYVAKLSYAAGAGYDEVFRFTGTVAIIGYALGNVPNSIWKGVSWITTLKFIFDGIIYGLVTAGTFGWLWPEIA